MKIVVLDDYQDCVRTLACFDRLRGHDVRVSTAILRDERAVAETLGDAQAVVLIRERTKITRSLLDRLPALRLIAQTGRPGPHIDQDACREKGVTIVSGTGSPFAPAELTWALILAARRGIVTNAVGLREGQWGGPLGSTVRGRTLGILGYGRIGRLVAGYGKAFGMRVIAYGRGGSKERSEADGLGWAPALEALFAESDVLSVHLRLTAETRGLVTLEHLLRMKADSLFVNTSRSEVVVRGALLEALNRGRPGSAALDVFDQEPALHDPLVALPNVLATPHVGYVERAGYEQYFGEAFEGILAFFAEKTANLA